jgi:hypothetical protein
MDVNEFWQIIGEADTPQELHDRLAALPESDLADFELHHQQAFAESYDWSLWGAAYVINGGCSDDCFDYFRAYLISRGREVYQAALADPDSLADAEIEDEDEWEEWMSPTMMVVHARTGEYSYVAPDRHARQSQDPRGDAWDEDDLERRFPRLTAKYG